MCHTVSMDLPDWIVIDGKFSVLTESGESANSQKITSAIIEYVRIPYRIIDILHNRKTY